MQIRASRYLPARLWRSPAPQGAAAVLGSGLLGLSGIFGLRPGAHGGSFAHFGGTSRQPLDDSVDIKKVIGKGGPGVMRVTLLRRSIAAYFPSKAPGRKKAGSPGVLLLSSRPAVLKQNA